MKKSNIFVYIELQKLVECLTSNILLSKQQLKSQAGYFNIIPPKYFSDKLLPEWESILKLIKQKGPQFDEDGRVVANEVVNTIDQMTERECVAIAFRIIEVYEKVKLEFE